VLFSATLSPLGYYRETLGGERSDETLEVSSPFAPEQLSVSIMDKISTRYSEREDTLLAIVRTIAATVSAKRGNYMVFTPSFEYNEALAKAFELKYPKLHIITQKKNMTAKEKSEFLDEFKKDDASYLIGFCVMGGIYSEGVDLAGDSLIGAVIVGIGMPSLSYEREAIAEYYQEKYEEGKQYAYIYPGFHRVLQAAGRVIRRESDRGVIVLIDDRFADPLYKKSVPQLWHGLKFVADAKGLRMLLDKFWAETAEEKAHLDATEGGSQN
jgi:Rad3-related DNA helicase